MRTRTNNIKSMAPLTLLLASTLIFGTITLSGCSLFSSDDSASNMNTATGAIGDEDSEETALAVTKYDLVENSVNTMCNGGLKFAVTGVQRRPVSVFQNASISNDTGSAESGYSESDSIVMQIDVSYTWNINTYQQTISASGSDGSSSEPSTLSDIMGPGTLMYIEGEDADGNLYRTADIVSPKKQEDANSLAVNSQWDYDVLNSTLPETSVTKTGSMLFRVASTAKNLKLVIYSPSGGQSAGDADSIASGTIDLYEMTLS